MRGRASFALTALLLLFLLQSFSVLLATLYATLHDALYPALRPVQLVPLLLPIAALLAAAARSGRVLDRHGTITATAVVIALARIPLSLPQHWLRFICACVILAAGAVFIASVAGYIERRRIAGGLAAAITIDQIFRLAGWSWDLTMRTWWVLPQAALSGIVILLVLAWRSMPAADADRRGIFERRSGGLRLRGAVALGILLFLDLNFLARPEVLAQWTNVRYEVAAIALIGTGAAAALLLLAGHGPLGAGRRSAALLALLCTAALFVARAAAGPVALLFGAAGHAAALLLLGRALVPAGGRRPGRNVSALLGVWLGLSALYASTFFPSFTLPALAGALPWLLAASGAVLFALLMLLPRPLETRPPLQGRVVIAGIALLALAAAGMLSLRQRVLPVPVEAEGPLRVATWNVHHGFAQDRTFDPARIAETIAAAEPDVIALQEVGAGLPTAYGVDLVLYLSRRLRMPARFAATHNGLMGDALLHQTRLDDVQAVLLAGEDARVALRVNLPLDQAQLTLIATRLGLDDSSRAAQSDVIAALAEATAGPLVVLGDLNAEEQSGPLGRLRAAGLEDAFALAGAAPQPTAPARSPARRIDWILARGVEVEAAAVIPDGGSDHRMVVATLRVRSPSSDSPSR